MTNLQPEEDSRIAKALLRVANSITPTDRIGGLDAQGAYVASLTEAIMGMTSALSEIATAMLRIAEAIEDHQQPAEGK